MMSIRAVNPFKTLLLALALLAGPVVSQVRADEKINLADGAKTVVAKGLKMPEGLALEPNGKLVVAEVGAKRVIEVDPKDGKVTEIAGNLPIGMEPPPGAVSAWPVSKSAARFTSSSVARLTGVASSA